MPLHKYVNVKKILALNHICLNDGTHATHRISNTKNTEQIVFEICMQHIPSSMYTVHCTGCSVIYTRLYSKPMNAYFVHTNKCLSFSLLENSIINVWKSWQRSKFKAYRYRPDPTRLNCTIERTNAILDSV